MLIAVQAISDIRIPRVECVSKAVYEVREYSISPRHPSINLIPGYGEWTYFGVDVRLNFLHIVVVKEN